MSQTYIVGFDGTPQSRRAVEHAAAAAKKAGGKLHLVFVIEWSPYSFHTAQELAERHGRREQELDRAKESLQPVVDELKAEYRKIAERRVKLGLILSEVAQSNNIQIEQADLNRAMMAEARRYPGQETQVIKYFQENPQAMEGLRAPLMEDKVVDFVLEMAKLTDVESTLDEVTKDPDEAEAAAKSKPKPKKKAAAKKKKDEDA